MRILSGLFVKIGGELSDMMARGLNAMSAPVFNNLMAQFNIPF